MRKPLLLFIIIAIAAAWVVSGTVAAESSAYPRVSGHSDTLVGVCSDGLFSLHVGQQPENDPFFVTTEEDEVTQFNRPSAYGTIALLAHNHLAGAQFYNLQVGSVVVLVYGDGRAERFLVTRIEKFQALDPTSPFSDFISQEGTQEYLTNNQLFERIFASGNDLVLQTCLESNGEMSWGRLFVIGEQVQ